MLRDRALMAYVLAFAGNIWEVSAVRAWFVAYLAWTLSLPGNQLTLPALAVISGLASLAGFPVSYRRSGTDIALWQTGDRRDLPGFGAVCLALAATAGGPIALVLPLLVLVQITSIADAGALSSGAVAAADPAQRGTALAAYAFIGYTAAFAGPVAVGVALDQFGGADSAMGWSAAFATMALGSIAAACAMRGARGRRVLSGPRRDRVGQARRPARAAARCCGGQSISAPSASAACQLQRGSSRNARPIDARSGLGDDRLGLVRVGAHADRLDSDFVVAFDRFGKGLRARLSLLHAGHFSKAVEGWWR